MGEGPATVRARYSQSPALRGHRRRHRRGCRPRRRDDGSRRERGARHRFPDPDQRGEQLDLHVGDRDPDQARRSDLPRERLVRPLFRDLPERRQHRTSPVHRSPGTPTVNGLTGSLLTSNPNELVTGNPPDNPSRLDRTQPVTCDNDHDYTAEQAAFNGGPDEHVPREQTSCSRTASSWTTTTGTPSPPSGTTPRTSPSTTTPSGRPSAHPHREPSTWSPASPAPWTQRPPASTAHRRRRSAWRNGQ